MHLRSDPLGMDVSTIKVGDSEVIQTVISAELDSFEADNISFEPDTRDDGELELPLASNLLFHYNSLSCRGRDVLYYSTYLQKYQYTVHYNR